MTAEKGFAERFTEAQKSSQAMRHFLPKRTSSSSASSRPRPAPTQHTAKPTPTTPEPQPPEGAHARHDATPSRNAKDLSPRSLWILRLRNPPEQPGRKKRGPSLATTGPPRKQPLLYLSPPRLTLSAEDRVFMDPHGPTIVPSCPIAVIADKIKNIHFQNESKDLFLPTISVLPLCSQSAQPFQPLTMRAEAWQANPGVSTWVMTTVTRGYTLQFARRPPRFRVRSENAQVLHTEVMNLLEKGAI